MVKKLKVALILGSWGKRHPVLFCRGELEQISSSPDCVETKISGNVGPPNKQCTCAAIAEGACVSDLHAAWEVPHPPYIWNISALQGLNLTPALSSPSRACSISAVLPLGVGLQEELHAGGSTMRLTEFVQVLSCSPGMSQQRSKRRETTGARKDFQTIPALL